MEGQQLTKLSIYTSKDIKEICKFWSRNNYFDGITPAKLKIHLLWKYNSQFTTLWIVKKEGRIIGSCGRIETRLVSRGKFICNAPWGIDSLVDASLDKRERRFVFLKVFRSANREGHQRKEPEVGFCFPNQVVKDAYLRMGYLDTPIFNQYSKDIDREISSDDEFTFTVIKRFDYRWDKIWGAISRNFSMSVFRDHVYLNWRYIQNPDRKYIVLLVKIRNQIKGYFVLREKEICGRKVGFIVDFLA
ncbi:MAG: hypothetical protein JNN05_09240, partial [Candidatus Omnitrophica bacterium]|nr:hypothetical protein [Candidatus Omnitrophota bacterium]